MRRKIVAGNWKMNLSLQEGEALVADITASLPAISEYRRVVIAPPFLHLPQTVAQVEGRPYIYAGAQNCHQEASGAYTGEISAPMLQRAGVSYVIIGHSERRQYFNETDALLAKKTDQALLAGMEVIFCCGEPLDIREAGSQNVYVGEQIAAGLFHLSPEQFSKIIIAYEPIWAIGTGRTASSQQAQETHAHIRSVLAGKFGATAAANTTILYGGSCNAGNATELFACPDVDGGLIGGAALKAESFLAIVSAMIAAE